LGTIVGVGPLWAWGCGVDVAPPPPPLSPRPTNSPSRARTQPIQSQNSHHHQQPLQGQNSHAGHPQPQQCRGQLPRGWTPAQGNMAGCDVPVGGVLGEQPTAAIVTEPKGIQQIHAHLRGLSTRGARGGCRKQTHTSTHTCANTSLNVTGTHATHSHSHSRPDMLPAQCHQPCRPTFTRSPSDSPPLGPSCPASRLLPAGALAYTKKWPSLFASPGPATAYLHRTTRPKVSTGNQGQPICPTTTHTHTHAHTHTRTHAHTHTRTAQCTYFCDQGKCRVQSSSPRGRQDVRVPHSAHCSCVGFHGSRMGV
jgi:hypothetical protein